MRSLARRLVEGRGPFDRALDIGCGTGGNRPLLEALARSVVSLDPSHDALALAREKGPVLAADATTLPFGRETFDLVFLFNVLEHVEHDGAALREAARVLCPGGTLLVATSASRLLWGDHDVANHHHRRYAASELRRLLLGAGLSIVRVTHANALLWTPAAVVSALQRLRSRWLGPASQVHVAIDVPAPLGALLGGLLSAETRFVERYDLPFGVSLLAVAQK
jgi:SAM-dependent methyltransferase